MNETWRCPVCHSVVETRVVHWGTVDFDDVVKQVSVRVIKELNKK